MKERFEPANSESVVIDRSKACLLMMERFISESPDCSMLEISDNYDLLIGCFLEAQLKRLDNRQSEEYDLLCDDKPEEPEITDFSIYCLASEAKSVMAFYSDLFKKKGYVVFEFDDSIEVYSPFGKIKIKFIIGEDNERRKY